MPGEFPGFLKDHLPEERINRETLQSFRHEGRVFYRLKKDLHHLPRGTVFWEGGLIHGYQRIKRVLHLEEGIRRYFREGFYVEEKMDGYNVRIRRIGNGLYAFTRGGFLCPFTTDRLADLMPTGFFDTHPEHTVCAEVVGPENPYNTEVTPYVDEDVALFVFDIKDPSGRSLPIEERYGVYAAEGLPAVSRWGPFGPDDAGRVREIVGELDRAGREGVVMKHLGQGEEVKYVTFGSCLRDLEATAHLMTELPAGFYIQRLLRMAAITYEYSLRLDEPVRLSIADALMGPLNETVRRVAGGESIKEFFTVRVNREETVDALMRHLRTTGVSAHLLSVERKGGRFVARFYRTFPEATKELRRRLRGYGFYD